ncbi:MAG: 50S ribosomal protein L22 [Bacteroidales bacterium]|jgi:large subunit ribosomal protein L22|nr:50S ribosomal protein L22 [Bacteroidales bacterium]NCU37247.1 50S ribosomal protein L22 [Candidatus Falkowbacteria bacterium]MDD2630939.1 50S ribosomal protein L22 [Bacteroidales bacterium]MDD3131202.1 50S ribosomal protein L22 [Bacteroidales bacterium]MDD3525370.1 50S ribosomal protein L22 [Bacteroidales bacterium]
MGARKHNTAQARKEANKTIYFAKLNNCPTSPRKMRLMADLVRGQGVEMALNILKFKPNHAAERLYKLILSAIDNWQEKNKGVRLEDSNLYIKSVMVDSARQLKRIRPAPQGRAHRIRKRSNHITVVVDSRQVQLIDTQE